MSLLFWLLVAGMLAVALFFLLPVLLRGQGAILDSTEGQNLQLARDRLRELDEERDAGRLTDEELQQARQELEQQLATDLSTGAATKQTARPGRVMPAVVLIVLPLLAILIYQYLGDPAALQDQPENTVQNMPAGHPALTEGASQPSVDAMVARLAERLDQQPDDPQGWFMLGRSYMALERYPEAVQAFERLQQLVGDDPEVLVSYADALGMMQGGRLSGRPLELIEQALAMQPDHPTGQWLAGMAYREQGKYQQAIDHWQRAKQLLQADAGAQAELQNLIASTRQQAGLAVPADSQPAEAMPAIMAARITVTVELDPALKEQVSAEDTVFILARAISGPPMPLAVARKQVKDLPLTVTLDDAMAMMPAMRLSKFPEVSVVARVSRSGTPQAQSGDLEGVVTPVRPARQPTVQVRIDRKIP